MSSHPAADDFGTPLDHLQILTVAKIRRKPTVTEFINTMTGEIIDATVKAVTVPVTLKMRMGWDHSSLNAPELARIAEWLHAGGHGGRWRGELLAVEDQAGHVVGTIERAVVRPLGIATRAVAVLAVPLVAHRFAAASLPPELPVTPLADYRVGSVPSGEMVIVRLPAGQPVPVKVAVSGDLFRAAPDAVLPLTLDRPVDILLRGGTPTGDLRLPGEPWQLARESRWISIPWVRARLDPTAGPVVESALVVDFHGHPRN